MRQRFQLPAPRTPENGTGTAPGPSRSLRRHLMALVLAALLPMLLLAGFLVTRNALDQRAAAESSLRETARALVLALDADLTGIVNALEGAALASGFAGDDPARFQAAAAMLQQTHPFWQSVFLADAWGTPIMDTAARHGQPPPAFTETVRQAIIKAKPAVSPIISDSASSNSASPNSASKPPLVAVAVPLVRFGVVNGVVGAVLHAERWSRLLADQQVPDGWVGAIVDQNNIAVARARNPEAYVARPSPDWYGAATSAADEGLVTGRAVQGHMITIAFRRSAVAGWTLGFAAPEAALVEPLYRNLALMLLPGAGLVAVAVLLALRAGRRIAEPIRALARAARALEDDRPVPPLARCGVREVDELAAAIANAGGRLHEAGAERAFLLAEEARRRREAELANASKSRFLAAASHDLRQPFQAMRLYHYLLEAGLAGERAHDAHRQLGTAMQSGEMLLNALLDVSTLEAGTVRPQVSDLPIRDLLDAKLTELRPLAEAKGLTVHQRPCAAMVRSDPLLLGRIVGNLLANAVRYTQAGGILVACRTRGSQLRIEVWDTGIGIAQDKIEAIFEDFYQVENAARDHRHGLGLGLSVVQRTARLLGHPLTVRSRVGRGSLFAVTVPLAASTAQLPPPRTADRGRAPVRGLRILLVEDQADQRAALRRILEDAGHEVASAADGTDALDLLARLEAMPEFIVTDHRLPGPLTGADLVERVAERLERRIPSVIITGDTDPDRLREAAARGLWLLHKPIVPADLLEIVAAAADGAER
ncbi:hybrid sensor histidine kinase/response regulator [Azospirillum sp. sgz301742]